MRMDAPMTKRRWMALLLACLLAVPAMKIFIPEHAFEWMEISVSENLYPGKTIEVSVPAYSGTVITLI